jgi:hypothetical protein
LSSSEAHKIRGNPIKEYALQHQADKVLAIKVTVLWFRASGSRAAAP